MGKSVPSHGQFGLKGPLYRGDEVTPVGCPVARMAAETGTPCYSISRSVNPDPAGKVTEEFLFDSDVPVEDVELAGDELTRVFSYGSKDVYRFSRPPVGTVPVGASSSSIVQSWTSILETLQNVVVRLREQYSSLDVQ